MSTLFATKSRLAAGVGLCLALALPAAQAQKHAKPNPRKDNPKDVLWQPPDAIASRNLYWGSGGESGAPHGPVHFLREDLNGTNPKYDVRDRDGRKWTIKIGPEAQPETVASRLLWATGYGTRVDYVVASIKIEGLPAHLHRGKNLILPGGVMRDARFEHIPDGQKRVGRWRWRHNPFYGSRQFNGLRVMMALVDNWDLKDDNTSIYERKSSEAGPAIRYYVVSDLGASFGADSEAWRAAAAKGNAPNYARSHFVAKATPAYVDFHFPTLPPLAFIAANPLAFHRRMDMGWIGNHLPRPDVEWIAGLLGQLTPAQIRDAFRSADYSDADIETFSRALEQRIGELQRLRQ